MTTTKVVCEKGITYRNFARRFYGERCTWIRIYDDLELKELEKAIKKYDYDGKIIGRYEFVQENDTAVVYTISWPDSYVQECYDFGLRGESYHKWSQIKSELYKYRRTRYVELVDKCIITTEES